MENKIKALKEKLQYVGTRELLGMISIHFITFASDGKEFASNYDIFNNTRFLSPQKQYLVFPSKPEYSVKAVHPARNVV